MPGLTKKFRHVIFCYGAAVFFERMRLLRGCKLTKTFCKLVTIISCFWALLQVRMFFSLSYCCSEGHTTMLICKLLWIPIFSGHKIQGYFSLNQLWYRYDIYTSSFLVSALLLILARNGGGGETPLCPLYPSPSFHRH